MPKYLWGTFLMLAVSTGAWAVSVPRHAVPLEKYSSASRISEDAMRLRVSVATDAAQGERSVRVSDVLLCKATDCFRAHTAGYVDIGNTSTGTATVVADVVIPVVTITDVHFIETVGGTGIAGHLKLGAPLVMEKGFHGIELLIGVRKQQTAGKSTFVPVQSGNSYFNLESRLVHYLPAIQTVAKLPLGTVLTIPAGALDKAQVFHVSAHDSGDIYPSFDIYPYIKLNKPATVEAPAIPGGSSTREFVVPAGIPEERHLWAPQNSAILPKNGRVTLHHTMSVEPAAFEDSVLGPPKATPDTSSDANSARSLNSANTGGTGKPNRRVGRRG